MLAAFLLAAVLDLNALVAAQCGPPGYQRDGGCAIELPDGTSDLASTVQLGTCASNMETRNSVALIGRGAGVIGNNQLFQHINIGAGPAIVWLSSIGQLELGVASAVSQPNRPWMIEFSMGGVL